MANAQTIDLILDIDFSRILLSMSFLELSY